ncbi:hypothetical protein D3C81_1222580 [compost metagenome]
MSEAGSGWLYLEPFYNRAMGRVGRLIACGHSDGKAFKARLNAVKLSHQTPLLDRYKLAATGSPEAAIPPAGGGVREPYSAERDGPLPWD